MCRLRICSFAMSLLAVCVLAVPSPVLSQEQQAHPTKETLAKFGELPVRFNGRVTTYDRVATNYLRRSSGSHVCFDETGKEHTAARWLLDVMANSQGHDDWRIFKITDQTLLDRLNFKRHTEKSTENLFSIAEMRNQSEAFAKLQTELRQKPRDQFDEGEREFSSLHNHLAAYLDLTRSFSPPTAIDNENAPAIIDTLQQLESAPLPSFVPAPDGVNWVIYYRAFLLNALAEEKDKDERIRHLSEMFQAHETKDAEAFQKSLERYTQSLKGLKALAGPFDFSPSAAWLEVGVEPARKLFFYSDANAPGLPVVDLSLAEDRDARFIVNFFQGQRFSEGDLVNSWRFQLGLAPLAKEDLEKTWKPAKVAGRDAIFIDHETPEDVDLPKRTRYLTTIVKDGDQTFVFAFHAEAKVIGKHARTYHELMRSVRMKSPDELAAWFGGHEDDPPVLPERFLAAVVPDGNQFWVFATSGTNRAVESHREAFLEFLKTSERKLAPEQKTAWNWQLPQGWEKVGEYGDVTFVLGQDENMLPLTVMPLGDIRDNTLTVLVDYWSKKLGLEELSQENRKKAVQEISVASGKAFLIELKVPNKAEPVPATEITWQVPKNWKELPPGPLTKGSFEITHDNQSAKFTIMALPTNQNLTANINRWRAQLELPTQSDEEVLKSALDQKVGGQLGKLVEIHNEDTKQRILAAIVTSGEKDWFFKMMGDASAVETERKAFVEFMKSVKFPKRDQPNSQTPTP